MDVFFLQVLFHIGEIHPPDAVLILHQRGVDGLVAVVLQALGEADVGGAVDQHFVAPGADAVQRTDDAAQHTVLVADVLRLQAGDAVAGLVPADDAVKVLRRGLKIAEGRVLGALDDGFLNGGHGGEVHVRHPHGDGIEAFLRGSGRKAVALQAVHRNGVPAAAVNDRSEIVFHKCAPSQKIVHHHLNIFLRPMQPLAAKSKKSCGKITNFYDKKELSTQRRKALLQSMFSPR